MSASERAAELLELATRRGEMKRLGVLLDADPDLRVAVLAIGRSRGVELPDEAVDWPGKRLLRLARGLEQSSQVVRTLTARDDAFTCVSCGASVEPARRTARDHCPRCLHGLHVDVFPGDRASDCGGTLAPLDATRRGDGFQLRYRCERCGAIRYNKALLDVDDPDDWEAIVRLTARAGT